LLVLIILDLFFDSYIVGLLQLITIIIIIYRFLSKNIYKRVKENQKFMDIKYVLFKPFKNIKRRIKDREHLYKKCGCGTTIKVKLPKKLGIKHAKCPNCGKSNVRLATADEIIEYKKRQEEFPTIIKRYVFVETIYGRPGWYIDEKDIVTEGSIVLVDYGIYQEVQGVAIQVLRCDINYPPYKGRIKSILEITKLK
jgi:hypothetical protein